MSLSDFSLQGKVAIVVGARRGMGRAFALGFAEAGADVVVTDLKESDGYLLKRLIRSAKWAAVRWQFRQICPVQQMSIILCKNPVA